MKAVTPWLSPFSPVRTMTTATSPLIAWVINVLDPFMTQYSTSSTAVVVKPPASDPEPVSVNPHAPINSALANFAKYFCFCLSLAQHKIWLVHKDLCAATDKPMEPQTLEISSNMVIYS